MPGVRCGHSSDCGSSAFHEGGQAPAEPRAVVASTKDRAHEAVREHANMESRPYGALISAQPCLSVARRGHAPVSPPAARALRGARTVRASSRCRREAPIEARRQPGTTGVPTAFYRDHLHRGFWQAFVALRLSWKCSCSARPVPRSSPGTSAYRWSRRESISGRQLPCRSGTFLSGHTPRFSTGGRARSNNEGQTNAAPSNPGMQRTRYARR
jgi:hypothetical protein